MPAWATLAKRRSASRGSASRAGVGLNYFGKGAMRSAPEKVGTTFSRCADWALYSA